MAIFVDVAKDILIAKNTQYLASDVIASLKKKKGLIDSDYPTLIRIVRNSLDWANGTSGTSTTSGDFSIDDFLTGDFAVGITTSTPARDPLPGVDIVANYLYALCGKYAPLASVVGTMECVPVWGVAFSPTFSCDGGASPTPTIGVFAYEFNNIFN